MGLTGITEAAARRIQALMAREERGADCGLRIGVKDGGCSGMRYIFEFDEGSRDGDVVQEFHGIRVFVDAESLPFVEGSTLDFVDTLQESAFKMKNPNAASSCGCGESFGV